MWAEARPYSALMPANLITSGHFSDSVATYAPNSVAVKIIGIVPRSASRALISGGVPFGAPTPPPPCPCLVSRKRLGNGRHIRQHVKSIVASYAKRPQRTGAYLRQRCHHHIESNLHLSGD